VLAQKALSRRPPIGGFDLVCLDINSRDLKSTLPSGDDSDEGQSIPKAAEAMTAAGFGHLVTRRAMRQVMVRKKALKPSRLTKLNNRCRSMLFG